MESNQKHSAPKTSAKDFFLNLGAIVALYAVVVSLLNLLFQVINVAYPKITENFYYSPSVSFPQAVLIIFFPIFVLLMWVLEKGYKAEPEKKHIAVRRWLTYITLFIAGLTLAGDLVTILYYFLDGQELTTGFLLKILSVLVVTLMVFAYYISDIRGKLTRASQQVWLIVSFVLILASIAWGFAVLGSPRTQQLLKYDQEKINGLTNISSAIESFYSTKGVLPKDLAELSSLNYITIPQDTQSKKPFEYTKTGDITYSLCAEFNKASPDATTPNTYMRPIGYISWTHAAGRSCFNQSINPNLYPTPKVPAIR
jgi:hypothetical protein